MSESTEQLRSLWIPLRQVNMLLPHAVVAEIGNYRVPDGRGDTPDWMLGDINWRGIAIPVVSLETFCGESAPANLVYSRLLIINSVRPGSSVPFDSSLMSGAEPCGHEALQCRLAIDGEIAVIPDLDYLQGQLERHAGKAA